MNILYGLPSEGMGHATRSHVIIQYLLSVGYDLQIVTSDRAFTFLSEKFPGRVHSIQGFHLGFKGAEVSISKTIWQTIKKAPVNFIENLNQYLRLKKEFRFDVVISDFESFTAVYALIHQLPLLSIDNMQVIDRCKLSISIPSEQKANYVLAQQIIKHKVPHASHYFMTSFFDAVIKKRKTSIIPSIIREQILSLTTSYHNHVVVYQSALSEKELVAVLNKIKEEQFYVFGFNREEQLGNVHLKKFSEGEFLDLFASSKAVLCNAGFSFISEAVYLHKPIFAVPIANQFEQYVNAAYVEQLHYGVRASEFNTDQIEAFLKNIETYKTHLLGYHQDGNMKSFEAIHSAIQNFQKF